MVLVTGFGKFGILSQSAAAAGTITIRTFNSTADFTIPADVDEIEYLIVAGGAGGGSNRGGGGGAGGFRIGTGQAVTGGDAYTFTIGAGGAANGPRGGASGDAGNNSSIGSPVSLASAGGGLGKGGPNAGAGGNGGSGGGGVKVRAEQVEVATHLQLRHHKEVMVGQVEQMEET